MCRLIKLLRAGRQTYTTGLILQKNLQDGVRSGTIPDTLVLIEHPPVYTVGLRDTTYTEDEATRLEKLGASFHRTDRGGLITFHGPGQLVAYPVLDLRRYKPSVRWYVSCLEKSVILLCEKFGIKANTSPYTGVWVNDSKICAIGIHVSRYVTTHGLALNCNTDLTWFSHIVPCGIEGKTVTSLSTLLNRNIGIEDATPGFLETFSEIFSAKIEPMDDAKLTNLMNN